MSISDVLPYVPIVAVIVAIVGLVLNYLHRKSDKIRRVIIDLIKNFVDPTIQQLKIDSRITEFEFPDLLNDYFGISGGNEFKRFSKTKRIMGWRIKKYNEYCKMINDKITDLGNRAKEKGLVESVHYIQRDVIRKSNYENLLELTKKYEDLSKDQIEDLLKEHNLNNYKQEINELLKKLPEKSKKLCKILEKLRDKWIRRYYLLESDF